MKSPAALAALLSPSVAFAVHLHPQRMAAERSKGTQAAGEHDDLLVFPGPAERVEHQVDAVVVAVDERIVEDDRHIATALRQKRAHGETHQHSDLLLRAAGEPLEAFGA